MWYTLWEGGSEGGKERGSKDAFETWVKCIREMSTAGECTECLKCLPVPFISALFKA